MPAVNDSTDLPEGVSWKYLERWDQYWLVVDGREVALVSRRAGSGWAVSANRQRGLGEPILHGSAATLSHARKMVRRWALANLDRIRREIAARPTPGYGPGGRPSR